MNPLIRRSIMLVASVAPFIFFVLIILAFRPSSVTKASLERVKNGLLERQVEEILGQPANSRFEDSKGALRIWDGRDGSAQVVFDKDFKVCGRIWIASNESIGEVIWRRVFLELIRFDSW